MIAKKLGLVSTAIAAAFIVAMPISFDGGSVVSKVALARGADNAGGDDYGCSGGRGDDGRFCGREDHHHRGRHP